MLQLAPTYASETIVPAATSGADTERRCAVTRATAAKAAMVRFVVDPDGRLVPDVEERLPGRGLWIVARRDIVNAAGSSALSRAARAPVTIPEDLADRVEALLARRCLEALGLSRRAGEAIAGYEKVRQWLRAGRGHVILTAADAAAGGREKVRGLAPEVPVVDALTRAELGMVFGREDCVHAVVSGARLGERLVRDGRRLAGFRENKADDRSERSNGRA